MSSDLISDALTRVEAARFRKPPEFGRRVEEALREALLQPFGKPLDVARVHSRSRQPHRRAIWQAVVTQLEQNPHLQVSRPVAQKTATAVETPPDTRRYRVGLLTDVGPGTPAARLNALAIEGVATVKTDRAEDGEPSLLYFVPNAQAAQDFEELRDDVVGRLLAAE